MGTPETRSALEAFFAARASGDIEALRGRMADDVRGVWPEGAPIDGYEGSEALASVLITGSNMDETGLDKAKMSATPLRTLVDGSTAVIELAVEGKTTRGTPYVNTYVYFYEFSDEGLLTELRIHTDTIVSARQLPDAFAAKVAQLNGAQTNL